MKFYKIIGNNTGKYPYRLGLNTLKHNNETFYPYATCGSGGLYYTTIDHIFEYLSYGSTVCVLSIPETSKTVRVKEKYKSDKIIIEQMLPLDKLSNIKYLVERGAIVNESLLYYACSIKNFEMVKYITSVNKDIIHQAHIIRAISLGELETIKHFLSYSVGLYHDFLKTAVSYNKYNIVEYLILKGLKADDRDVCRACAIGNKDLLELLLKNGGYITELALYEAVYYDHRHIIEFLIEKGVSVSDDALYIACEFGNYPVVELLLKHGANNKNQALKVAIKAEQHLIIDLLLKNGANKYLYELRIYAKYQGYKIV